MRQHDVHIFVFDTLSDWEIGFAAAGINGPRFQFTPGRFRVRTVGLSLGPVVTMGGIRILPDMPLELLSPDQSAMLILPGGAAWDAGQNTEAVKAAGRFLEAGRPVAAICGATIGLARAGLLDQRRHTSNSRDYLATTQYRGAALYQDEPAVSDGDLITASGVAPIEFAQHVFRRLRVYSKPVLEAWYALFKTGRIEHFAALARAANAQPRVPSRC